MRFKPLDLLLFSLLFIFAVSFPVDLFPIDIISKLIIKITLRALILAYDIYVLWRNKINIFKFANYRRGLLFLPFILICFSNLFAALIAGKSFGVSVDGLYLFLIILYHLLSVVLEEFLFRLFIQNSLVFANSLKRIFASAGIFALFHLLNIVDVSSVDALANVLMQVVYAFGLGLLLALLYEYTYSIPLCVLFHFLFNFFNRILIENIFSISFAGSEVTYYLTAVISGVVVGVYALLIYIFVLRRNDRYFSE